MSRGSPLQEVPAVADRYQHQQQPYLFALSATSSARSFTWTLEDKGGTRGLTARVSSYISTRHVKCVRRPLGVRGVCCPRGKRYDKHPTRVLALQSSVRLYVTVRNEEDNKESYSKKNQTIKTHPAVLQLLVVFGRATSDYVAVK